MNKPFKPTGYNSVSPYFIVNGAQKLVDLVKKVFNATEMRRYGMPDGTIMHIELKIDDSIIMLGDASEQFPAITQLIHIYVSNVDDVFDRAIKAGCISIESPKQREGDPDRRGTFKDFAGNTWSIGTQLST